MSDQAQQRIRRFSRYTWMIGAAVIGAAAFIVVPQVAVLDDGRLHVNQRGNAGERIYPYHEDAPVELTLADGRITGDQRGGWIPFGADAEPITLRLAPTHDDVNITGEYINIFQTADETRVGDTRHRPISLSALWDADDVVYATPALTDGRLWFSAVDPRWEVIAEPIESAPISEGSATGSGDARLSYRGDALSARITHTGQGFLRVTAFSPEFRYEREPAVNDVDDFATRISWSVPGTVLFRIESTGGEWSVMLDE